MAGDNLGKLGLIPRNITVSHGTLIKDGLFAMLSPGEGVAEYQLVGEVMAHQGYDA